MLLRFFAKVRSQAIQYGPWRSLRPSSETRQVVPAQVWFWGGGKLIMILEIAAGPDGSTTELKLDLKFSTYKGGGVDERGIGTLN
jgi:hypothetical protein